MSTITLTRSGDEADAISRAYTLVGEGYRLALAVPGLPPEEAESLRTCLRAALQISDQPMVGSVTQ